MYCFVRLKINQLKKVIYEIENIFIFNSKHLFECEKEEANNELMTSSYYNK